MVNDNFYVCACYVESNGICTNLLDYCVLATIDKKYHPNLMLECHIRRAKPLVEHILASLESRAQSDKTNVEEQTIPVQQVTEPEKAVA